MIESLIEKAKAGDKAAENQIFKSLRESFILIAKHRLRDLPHRTHEDIVQEACATVLEKYRTEQFDKGFMHWAYGVLRNKIGNAYQYQDRHPMLSSVEADHMGTSLDSANHQLGIIIRRCFEKLIMSNLRYARLVNLAHQGYDTEEICQRLGLTVQNCHTLLSRSREKLRECMESGGNR